MSVEAGPSGAGLAGTAPVAVGEFSTIVIDGPLSRGDLENTMTIAKFDPVGEIVFKQAEAIAAAAWEASKPALPELQPAMQRDEPLPQEAVLPVVLPKTEPLVVPQIEPQVEPAPKTETRVLSRISPAISPQPLLQEQEVEEEVLEKVEHEESEDSLGEEEETEKRLFLEDEKALAVRKFEIKQAIKLAKLSTIVGSVVARFLPGEHAGNRS